MGTGQSSNTLLTTDKSHCIKYLAGRNIHKCNIFFIPNVHCYLTHDIDFLLVLEDIVVSVAYDLLGSIEIRDLTLNSPPPRSLPKLWNYMCVLLWLTTARFLHVIYYSGLSKKVMSIFSFISFRLHTLVFLLYLYVYQINILNIDFCTLIKVIFYVFSAQFLLFVYFDFPVIVCINEMVIKCITVCHENLSVLQFYLLLYNILLYKHVYLDKLNTKFQKCLLKS